MIIKQVGFAAQQAYEESAVPLRLSSSEERTRGLLCTLVSCICRLWWVRCFQFEMDEITHEWTGDLD